MIPHPLRVREEKVREEGREEESREGGKEEGGEEVGKVRWVGPCCPEFLRDWL